jgi:tRNA 2-selenouridine synthase
MKVFQLCGGYKSFRRWVLGSFAKPCRLTIVGGETGSGKTDLLRQMAQDRAVIDLEDLACHRGSVFGDIGSQPSQEQFENSLACALECHRSEQIWIEDESQKIGSVKIPTPFFVQMRQAPAVILQRPFEARLQACLDEYLPMGPVRISAAIMRLEKRLGSNAARQALSALQNQDYRQCCQILLSYYDKKYRYGISQRDPRQITYTQMPE